MSLSTRRPAGGIPSSVRPPRNASVARGREPPSRAQDDSPPPSDNKYRTQLQSQRSRSVPRQDSEISYRSRRAEGVPPMPSTPSRHSVQSSGSSLSSASSALSAASTAPSSVWDYVGWKANPASGHGDERSPSPEPVESHPGDGNTIWSRVAAAAGGLSINVGKAWEAKDDLPEPETPPGHDSRVTTALKKHYIKQVSDPRQLPAWLFSDVERQVGRSFSRPERSNTNDSEEGSYASPTSAAPIPSRARARHEDAYAQPQAAPMRERARPTAYGEEYTGPTRAATRLKALRDARRAPVEREVYAPAAVYEPEPIPVAPTPRPRVGLPSRPVRVRRE